MNDKIVIDFGTSRTKAAYYNSESSKPTLIRLGKQDAVPSIFYIEKDGNILYGDVAQQKLKEQEVGSHKKTAPIRGLKLKLRSRQWRWSTEYRSEDLLTPLFKHIRERAAGLHGFNKVAPTQVILTTTKQFGPDDRETLKRAAQDAGFEEVTLIPEPSAVAQGWATATNPDRNHVVVLDCGGGTTDWTYLHREDRNFRVVPELSGAATPVGGHNVDTRLARFIAPQLEKDPHLLNEVSTIKEMFCNGITELPAIQIGSRSSSLNSHLIEQVIREAFINPICKEISPFIEAVKEAMGEGNPAILLVGGSAKLHGLKDALENEFKCDVNPDWPDAEFAPVLGAVPLPSSAAVHTSQSQDRVKELDRQLADQFRDMATLIGKPQKQKVDFKVGETKHTVAPGLGISSEADKLSKHAAHLEKGSLKLAVIGDFSAGKSTLINAMIGKKLLPMGRGTCTCVATEIVYGTSNEVTIVKAGSPDETISFEEFQKTYQFKPEERREFDKAPNRPERLEDIEYALLESESGLCRKGVRFVDTLGVNADDLSDHITEKFIAEADTLLVVTNESISESTRDVVEAFIKSKGTRHAGGNKHVFFVHNFHEPSTRFIKDEDEKRKEVEEAWKKAANDLHHQLIGTFDNESLYESRVFIVNAETALHARTNPEYQGMLEDSGLPRLEAELLKFMYSIDRISVVVQRAFINTLSPARIKTQSHIDGKLAYFDNSVADIKKNQHQTRNGISNLSELVEACNRKADAFIKDKQDGVVRAYKRELEDKLADQDFENYWESQQMTDLLKKDKSTANKVVEAKTRRFLANRFAAVCKEVNQQFPLAQDIQEELEPIIKSFFTKLHEITPYKTKEEGFLDDLRTLNVQVVRTFDVPFSMPSISVTEPTFKGWDVVTLGISTGFRAIKNRRTKGQSKAAVLAELGKTRAMLGTERGLNWIKNAIDQHISNIVDTVVARLKAEITDVENQLEDAINIANGKRDLNKGRLQKIKEIFMAKYAEISRTAYGKVLDGEDVYREFNQTQQTKQAS